MLKRIYVEITNVCNLRCSFCHGTRRTPRLMSAEEFKLIAEKLRGYTEYVYLHVLGEPLLHPQLGEMIGIAADAGLSVCITTNGTLLRERSELLFNNARSIHKLSVSLHSLEANGIGELSDYLGGVTEVCTRLAQSGVIIALRLWNSGGADAKNGEILRYLSSAFGEPEPTRMGPRFAENIWLEHAEKFDWPDENAPEQEVQFCRALRDQAAVLCDGTVVPCCLDAEGTLALGNIFSQELGDILASERAGAIYNGFSARRPVEELCRKCGYARRFNV